LYEFNAAKECHFISTKNDNLLSMFFHWCEANREPFIYIRKRRCYATVVVDRIMCSRHRLSDKTLKEVERVLKVYSAPGALLSWGETYINSSKVSVERAEELAALLYAIVTSPQPLT
jgi:hypothetical protein